MKPPIRLDPNPQAPLADPIPIRIRRARAALGHSLQGLALRVSDRLRGSSDRDAGPKPSRVSRSYLSLIENGRKVPSAAMAAAIAEALGESPELFRAWVALRKRADLPTVLAAARLLEESLGEIGAAPLPHPVTPRAAEPPGQTHARVRVPRIAAGADPGDGLRPACDVLDWLKLDLATIPHSFHHRLHRPFAFRATEDDARRVGDPFTRGRLVLVVRDFQPPTRDDVHVARHAGRLLLARVLWNGAQLLLLPAAGASDFVVIPAPDEATLRLHLVGAALPIAWNEEESR